MKIDRYVWVSKLVVNISTSDGEILYTKHRERSNVGEQRKEKEKARERERERESVLVGLRLAQFFNNACGKYRLSIFSFSCHSNQQRVFPFVVSRFDIARRFSYPPSAGPIVSNRTKRKETKEGGRKKAR